jgi:hypothetical protein
MKVHCFSPLWTLPSKMDSGPLIWMVEVDGFIVDVRQMSVAVQEVAYLKELLPYVPAPKDSNTTP